MSKCTAHSYLYVFSIWFQVKMLHCKHHEHIPFEGVRLNDTSVFHLFKAKHKFQWDANNFCSSLEPCKYYFFSSGVRRSELLRPAFKGPVFKQDRIMTTTKTTMCTSVHCCEPSYSRLCQERTVKHCNTSLTIHNARLPRASSLFTSLKYLCCLVEVMPLRYASISFV